MPKFLPERDNVTFVYLLSQIRLSSVCLSSVTFVHLTLHSRLNIRLYFYATLYVSDPLTSKQNFREIVPEEPLRRELNARGVAKYSDFGPVEGDISETVQDTTSGTIND